MRKICNYHKKHYVSNNLILCALFLLYVNKGLPIYITNAHPKSSLVMRIPL